MFSIVYFLKRGIKIYLIIVNFQTFFLKFFYIVLRPNQKIRGQIDFDVKKKKTC